MWACILKEIHYQKMKIINVFQKLSKIKANMMIKANLAAFRYVITECDPFLKRFQSQKPLAPFLYTFMQELVTNLLSTFVKPLKFDKIDSILKLLNFDFSHADNLILSKA